MPGDLGLGELLDEVLDGEPNILRSDHVLGLAEEFGPQLGASSDLVCQRAWMQEVQV